jgi:excisionase family DNA binding protein
VSTFLLSVAEAAEHLGKSPAWLAGAARRGEVPSRKVGRSRKFTPKDIEDYLDRVRKGTDPWARSTRSQARRRRSA